MTSRPPTSGTLCCWAGRPGWCSRKAKEGTAPALTPSRFLKPWMTWKTGRKSWTSCLKDRVYRGLLRSRGNFQEVMLGYSDSVKDGGYFAANWALFRAQKRLWEVAEKHKIRLGLFHGKGGTIGRGGGQSHRSVQAQPYAAPGGRMRITEQGEVISLKYANLEIAERNMEQLVTSVLDTHLPPP